MRSFYFSFTRKKYITAVIISLFSALITNAQNVGVSDMSTFTPQSLFHIYKNSSGLMTLMQLANSTTGSGSGAGLTIDVLDASFNLNINNRAASNLSFSTSGAQRMIILSGGNVGIGITNPVAKLHVAGGGQIIGTNGTSANTRTLTILNDGQAQVNFGSYPGAWSPALQIQNNDNTRYFWLSPLDNASGANARFLTNGTGIDFYTGSNAYAATITSAGDVGIGTTNPYGKVHIVGGHLNLGSINDPSVDQGNNWITWGYRSDNNPYYCIRTNYKAYGSYTYSRLQLNWHTGIEIGASSTYGGTRFFNNSPGMGGTQIMSIGDGDNHVRVYNNLYAPIMYDWNDASYYSDPNGTSELNQLTTSTRARWRMPRWWTNRTTYTADQNYWTGTNGWGTSEGTWADAWKGGFSGWDIWGTSTDHPQGSGYVHAQGIVAGEHYASTDGSQAYGWMMVGAANATDNRYWLRGKWGGTTSAWTEMITTSNIGSYGDNLGNHTATTTLNMNTNNISNVGDIYATQNYGLGLVGVYDSYRYQNVWAMGTSWRLAADGTTPGNLYGLAWTHTNVGGQSKPGLSHQLLVMENGVTKVALGTGIWTTGNLTFGDANPYITATSYFIAPGGAYFNSGTVYTEAQYQCRGGIHNDTGGNLVLAGGTSGTTYFSGPVSGMSGNYPSNYMIRLTPNLHFNSNAGYAVITNWDNGTTGNTMTFRVGNGAGADVFDVYANGNVSFTGLLMPNGNSGTSGQTLLSQGGSSPIWSPFTFGNTSATTVMAKYYSSLTITGSNWTAGQRRVLTVTDPNCVNGSAVSVNITGAPVPAWQGIIIEAVHTGTGSFVVTFYNNTGLTIGMGSIIPIGWIAFY